MGVSAMLLTISRRQCISCEAHGHAVKRVEEDWLRDEKAPVEEPSRVRSLLLRVSLTLPKNL